MELTKAAVLQGRGLKKTLDIPEMGEGLTVTIRPMTEGEFAQAEAIEGKGLKFKGNPNQLKKAAESDDNLEGMEMEMDISKINESEFKAKTFIVATCIVSEEKWTQEDVAQMQPIGIVDRLVKEIKEISGVTKGSRKGVKDFRKDT